MYVTTINNNNKSHEGKCVWKGLDRKVGNGGLIIL